MNLVRNWQIRNFEETQRESGTKVALFNFVFEIVSELLHGADPNISRIKITRFKRKKNVQSTRKQ